MKYFMSHFNTSVWSLPSLLDGAEYPKWKQEMQWFLCINHPMLWKSITVGPHIPVKKSFNGLDFINKHPTEYTDEDKVLCEKDIKALECLKLALPNKILSEIGNHGTAFSMWKALRVKFEGNQEERRPTPSKEATTTTTHQSTLTVNINELPSEVTQGLCSQVCTDKVLRYRRHNQTLIDESTRISKANDELIKNEKMWQEKVDSLNETISDLRDTIGVKNTQMNDLLSRFTKAKSELSETVEKLTQSEFKLTQMYKSSEALKLALTSGKTNKYSLGYNAMPSPNDYTPLPKVVNLTDFVKTNSFSPDPNFTVSAATTENFIVSNADLGVKAEEDCVKNRMSEKECSNASSSDFYSAIAETDTDSSEFVTDRTEHDSDTTSESEKKVFFKEKGKTKLVENRKKTKGKDTVFEPEKVASTSSSTILKPKLRENKRASNVLNKRVYKEKIVHKEKVGMPKQTQVKKVIQYSTQELLNHSKFACTSKFNFSGLKENVKRQKCFVQKENVEPKPVSINSFVQHHSKPKFLHGQNFVYMTKIEATKYKKRKISERKLNKKYGWKPKEIRRPKSQLSKESESEKIWKPKSVKVNDVSHDSKRKNESHSESKMVFRSKSGSDNIPKIEKDMSDLICLKIKVYDLEGRPKFVDAWVSKCN